MSERIILGPCPCQGCGQEVVYVVDHGWLHEDGQYRCQVIPAGTYESQREYNRLWMRRKRDRDERYRERERAYSRAYQRRRRAGLA